MPSDYDVQRHANRMLDLNGNPMSNADGSPRMEDPPNLTRETSTEDYYNDVLAALPPHVVNAPLKRAELLDYLDDIKRVMQSNTSRNVRGVIGQQAREHLISYFGADRNKLPQSLDKGYGDESQFPQAQPLRGVYIPDPLAGKSRAEILQTPAKDSLTSHTMAKLNAPQQEALAQRELQALEPKAPEDHIMVKIQKPR